MTSYFDERNMTSDERDRFRAYGTFAIGLGAMYLFFTKKPAVSSLIPPEGNAKLTSIIVTQTSGFGTSTNRSVDITNPEDVVSGFNMNLGIGIIVRGSGTMTARAKATYADDTESSSKDLQSSKGSTSTSFTLNNQDFIDNDGKSIKSYSIVVTVVGGGAQVAATFTVGA